jgi:hypothetical protein
MSTVPDNKPIAKAGEQLLSALEAFVEDADLAQRDSLTAHIKAMHAALSAFKDRPQQAHSAAAGLC